MRKIHALHDLLSNAVVYNPELEVFRKLCERVSGYYLAERYPPLGEGELTCENIEKDVERQKDLSRLYRVKSYEENPFDRTSQIQKNHTTFPPLSPDPPRTRRIRLRKSREKNR